VAWGKKNYLPVWVKREPPPFNEAETWGEGVAVHVQKAAYKEETGISRPNRAELSNQRQQGRGGRSAG